MRNSKLRIDEPAPWFDCRSPNISRFQFNTIAGRYIVLCFFGSSSIDLARLTLDEFRRHSETFNGIDRCFFGISVDPQDEAQRLVQEQSPGMRLFWDFDRQVSTLYGVNDEANGAHFTPHTFVLDERMRIAAIVPFSQNVQQHVDSVMTALNALPPFKPASLADVPAPVLIIPRIFEPALCQRLIDYYDQLGGVESGFMREINGKTVAVQDHVYKRRCDQEILDEQLRKLCMQRIHNRLVPEIQKAFQFRATRIERYIVACYDSSNGGHFRAHRDNTTKGTAHRRFAVSLNLNTGQYQGGQLWFPEFGRQRYVAPAGGAVVFSCSLLHEATPVTAGARYAFLPFLYDDEAAVIRQQNFQYVDVGADRRPPAPTA